MHMASNSTKKQERGFNDELDAAIIATREICKQWDIIIYDDRLLLDTRFWCLLWDRIIRLNMLQNAVNRL